MLILTRKTNECIEIGDDIEIKIVRIAAGRVRIGIDAPCHLRILRGELGLATVPADAECTASPREG